MPNDTPDTPSPLPALTDFTPVPRQFERAEGWTPEVQRAFIDWLADLGSVTEACRLVGRSTTGAYRLKRHPEAGEFAAAWARALAFAVGQAEDNAIDRAINGVEVPIFATRTSSPPAASTTTGWSCSCSGTTRPSAIAKAAPARSARSTSA